MVVNSAQQVNKQTETEIAVLQVQYTNLTEKVEDVKSDLKDLTTHIDTHMAETRNLIKEYQTTNVKAHEALTTKVSSIEKWKWMLMGGIGILGAAGVPIIEKLLGVK